MPVKAPVPCCGDPWVGFYVGGNAGYSWGNVSTTASVAPFLQTNLFTYEFPGGAGSTSAHPNGPIAGGQAGYVWRLAPHWLAGIEGDYQWSGEQGSAVGGFSGSTPDCTSGNCSYTDLTGITSRIGPFGTLRLRAGAEVNNVWVYGTAGLAVGTVSVSGTNTLTLVDNVSHTIVGLYPTSFNLSATKTGISAGGGFEGLIGTSKHWRWKAEFLYLDLGSIGGGTFGGVTVNTGRFTDDILRFGINYRFGDDCCALPPPCCATK